MGDVVSYSGSWYRCIKANSGQTPSSTSSYWSNAPLFSLLWDSNKQYSVNDVTYYNGAWYRYTATTPSYGNNPTNSSYWTSAQTASSYWNPATSYTANTSYVAYGGVWYRCVANNSNKLPNDTFYWTPTWSNSFGVTTGTPVVYAEAIITLGDNAKIKTQLRATLAQAPIFPNAIGATTNLTITTGTGTVDSYDSGIGAYNGTYSGVTNIGSSAVLAAGNTLAIKGTTAISGYLAWPSPPSGISSGTTINGVSYSTDQSRVSRSPNIPQYDMRSVAQSTALPSFPSGGLTIGVPGATVPSVYSYSGNLTLKHQFQRKPHHRRSGHSRSPSNLRIQSSCKITIASTGSLELHVSGRLRIDASGGGIVNNTSDPKKCIILSTATTGSHNFSTTQLFYGVIYMPGADLTVDTGAKIYGALSARNITFSAEATVHYDTSLRYAQIPGVDQPYAVTDWRVLPQTEQATMP